jgi:hypothetical protein
VCLLAVRGTGAAYNVVRNVVPYFRRPFRFPVRFAVHHPLQVVVLGSVTAYISTVNVALPDLGGARSATLTNRPILHLRKMALTTNHTHQPSYAHAHAHAHGSPGLTKN